VRHLLLQVVQPVQFDACLRSVIAAEPNTQFVEFGPGRVLTALADNVIRESVKSRQPSASNSAEPVNDAGLAPSVAALSTVEHCVAFIKSQR
jgi:malonyl CoA-acyl carrier protein transacylase